MKELSRLFGRQGNKRKEITFESIARQAAFEEKVKQGMRHELLAEFKLFPPYLAVRKVAEHPQFKKTLQVLDQVWSALFQYKMKSVDPVEHVWEALSDEEEQLIADVGREEEANIKVAQLFKDASLLHSYMFISQGGERRYRPLSDVGLLLPWPTLLLKDVFSIHLLPVESSEGIYHAEIAVEIGLNVKDDQDPEERISKTYASLPEFMVDSVALINKLKATQSSKNQAIYEFREWAHGLKV